MMNSTAIQFLRKIGESHKYHVPHHMVLSHNLECADISGGGDGGSGTQYQKLPYTCSLPLPLALPLNKETHAQPEDPNMDLINKKNSWLRSIEAVKVAHRDLSGEWKMKEIHWEASASTIVPSYVLKFAKLLKADPDEYFDSHFNWYISGAGNLCLPVSSNPGHIITTRGSALYINYLEGDAKTKIESNEVTEYRCKNLEPIHEIVLCETPQKNILGVRQKNKIHLVDYINEQNVQLQLLTIHNSAVPLTSVAFENLFNGVLYSDINGDIYLYDIESQHYSRLGDVSESACKINNWSCIKGFNDFSFVKVDRKNITIIDKRKQHASMTTHLLPEMVCDYVTAAQCGLNSFCLYLGTLHDLYQCDVRYLKCNNGQVKKWTHGLKSPPVFINNCEFNNSELIVLGSQLQDELCLINNNYVTNDKTHHKFNMFQESSLENIIQDESPFLYLPKHLPSILETYNVAQKKGFCLDPTINIKNRLLYTRTGLNSYKTDDGINLLSLNAAGDVFTQIISLENDKSIINMNYKPLQTWTDLLRPMRFPFFITSKINSKYFQDRMKKSSNKKITRRLPRKFTVCSRTWKKSLSDLSNYSDMWANELLAIWDVKETKQNIDSMVAPPVDTKFKVHSWISRFPMDTED